MVPLIFYCHQLFVLLESILKFSYHFRYLIQLLNNFLPYISATIVKKSETFFFCLCEAPVHGFGLWFEVEFNGPAESFDNSPSNLNPLDIIKKKRRRGSDDAVLLSTAPEDEPTHWQQVFVAMIFSFTEDNFQSVLLVLKYIDLGLSSADYFVLP